MQIALIGFSKSGKTTVFNALTGSNAETSAFAAGKAKTHRAVVEVPDTRLDRLCELFQSKKLVHATVDYLDPVGIRRDQVGQGASLGEDMLHTISTTDALAAVIRAFHDDSGVECDPEGDLEAILLELVLSDLAKVDTRLERVTAQSQRVGGPDRQRLEAEASVLKRLKERLESGRRIQGIELNADEDPVFRSFQFLTVKPLLVVVNTAEGEAGDALVAKLQEQTRKADGDSPDAPLPYFLALCGQTEMEIAQLPPDERAAFLAEYGIQEAGASRMIRLSYEALGVISFLTAGPTEAHAWTIPRGTPAVEAAGAIHSDLQRGFIRAQVTPWEDLLRDGGYAEAKKHAHLRVEGKEYIVQDGDVIEVMFSV
jgi:ribosome-binding ATPase